jgi:farnesyl-diphosphate farnesyltransferase
MGNALPVWDMPDGAASPDDDAVLARLLRDVSRTFALTIPQLPAPLRAVVGNAYLLCRIADTIEDAATLSADDNRRLSLAFSEVVAGGADPQVFATRLLPLLAPTATAAERELVRETPRVIRTLRGFKPAQQAALSRCIAIMADGMASFQATASVEGLRDLPELDRYCYVVAGCVGEMLTELFCDYSAAINRQRDTLLTLSVSFGQALQMTNVLKDVWEDRARGACWLPRDVFHDHGFDLSQLRADRYDERFGAGMRALIAVAHAHLCDALAYTLLIPSQERGIRRFCFWALGMAALTLRKLNHNLDYRCGSAVKISRRSVKTVIATTELALSGRWFARRLFDLATAPLPAPRSATTTQPGPSNHGLTAESASAIDRSSCATRR